MNDKLIKAIRKEAFVQGYVAAKHPETTWSEEHERAVLATLPDADAAYDTWLKTRGGGGDRT